MQILPILLLLSATILNVVDAANVVIIHSQTFTLDLINDDQEIIKTYPVGLGLNGMDKTKSGDKKTPCGEYQILWKASRFWEIDGGHPIVDGHAFCNEDNSFGTELTLENADEQLWTAAYGGDEAVVMCIDYPNASDIEKGYTGCCIEIHATLLGGIGEYSSAGCVRMYPKDARELYNQIEEGTKVIIR